MPEFLFPSPPPLFSPKELPCSVSSEEEIEEQKSESDEVHMLSNAPLPSLLGSTPLPSLLGSAPLYGKRPFEKNVKAHTFSAEVEPFVPAKLDTAAKAS